MDRATTSRRPLSASIFDPSESSVGALLIGLLLFGGVGASPSAAQQFINGQELGEGRTEAVATGDLNGDGAPDLVLGNTANTEIETPNTVWLNDGSGSFTVVDSIGTAHTLAVALVDIDGDDDLDLVVGNIGGNTVWKNDGTGTFTDTGQTLSNEITTSIAVGDLNGDDHPDFVVGNGGLEASENDNKVYLNDGNGTFTFEQSFGNLHTEDVALADVDGDGDLDMLAGNAGSGLPRNQLWLNDGTGTFSEGPTFPFTDTYGVAFADLNGDGAPDIVAGNRADDNVVWTNQGDGTFNNTQEFGGGSALTTSIAVGDLDGDGDPDLVEGLGDESGGGRPHRVWNNDGGTFSNTGQSLGDERTLDLAVADTDGDGDLDFVAGNRGAFNERAPSREWVNTTADGPTVQFTERRGAVSEGAGSTALAVEISNPDGNSVSVEVVTTASPGGSGDDFANFPSDSPPDTTVTFPASVEDGNTQTVPLQIVDDGQKEGKESASFLLQNLTTSGNATIGAPSQFDLTVEDAVSDHNGDVLITEFMAAPDAVADANGEYVELYNATNTSKTLDGWTLKNEAGNTAPISGVTIPARGFAVLCRNSDSGANGGILNCEDSFGFELSTFSADLFLLDDEGAGVDTVSYNGAPTGVSLVFTGTTDNRDANTGDPTAHWAQASRRERGYAQNRSGDAGSPGRNGHQQTLQPTASVTGPAEWRMLSAPMGGIAPGDLADVSLVQGISGLPFSGASPNLYQWPGGPAANVDWTKPPSAAEDLTGSGAPAGSGSGYIWYVFGAAETEFTDTPPFTIGLPGAPRTSDVTTDPLSGVSSGNSAFHLLGNPYAQSFDLSALNLSGQGFQTTVQVWDPSAGTYEPVTQSSTSEDVIAPYQGFFVERASSGSAPLTFDASGRRADPVGLKAAEEAPPRIEFRLVGRGENGTVLTRDEALMLHAPVGATSGWDAHDATKLTPLSGRYATAAFRDSLGGELRLQSVASIPQVLPKKGIELPISLQLQGTAPVETLRLRWPTWKNVPDSWGLALHDAVADSTVNLRARSSYAFSLPASKSQSAPSPRPPLALPHPIRAKTGPDSARFRLVVQPNSIPVELADFGATLSGETAELRWTTASETNNAGFHVEHRGPEAGRFESIGFVEGHGTTDRPHRYRFQSGPLDPGRHAFRLRQVDLSGAATRTDTVAVQARLAEAAKMAVAPNPVRTRATVSLRVRAEQSVTVALYDVLGRRVRTVHDGPMAPGRAHTLRVNASGLSSGLYLLRADGEQFRQTRRLTVVR